MSANPQPDVRQKQASVGSQAVAERPCEEPQSRKSCKHFVDVVGVSQYAYTGCCHSAHTADQIVLLPQAGWLSAKYRTCCPWSCCVRLVWRACCFCILHRQSHCSCRGQKPREFAGLLFFIALCNLQQTKYDAAGYASAGWSCS